MFLQRFRITDVTQSSVDLGSEVDFSDAQKLEGVITEGVATSTIFIKSKGARSSFS